MRAKAEEDEERLSYRVYMSESLRLQGEGKHLTRSWMDIIRPEQEDTRDAGEIAEDFMRRAGLRYEEGD